MIIPGPYQYLGAFAIAFVAGALVSLVATTAFLHARGNDA